MLWGVGRGVGRGVGSRVWLLLLLLLLLANAFKVLSLQLLHVECYGNGRSVGALYVKRALLFILAAGKGALKVIEDRADESSFERPSVAGGMVGCRPGGKRRPINK